MNPPEGRGIIVTGIVCDPHKRDVRIPMYSCTYPCRNPGNSLAYPSDKAFLGEYLCFSGIRGDSRHSTRTVGFERNTPDHLPEDPGRTKMPGKIRIISLTHL
jgi:hypothetical protein